MATKSPYIFSRLPSEAVDYLSIMNIRAARSADHFRKIRMKQMTAVNGDKNNSTWGEAPRYTALPVKDVLKIRMKDLGLRNTDM